MKKVGNFSISKETKEEMIAAGRFNPCMKITFGGRSGRHTHTISSGYEDDIHVYLEAGATFVLSANHRLGYLGLEVFEGNDAVGDVFLQGEQATETLGRLDLAPYAIIRKLREFVG